MPQLTKYEQVASPLARRQMWWDRYYFHFKVRIIDSDLIEIILRRRGQAITITLI